MQPFKKITDLKKNYTLFVETGLIISLLIFLVATKLPIRSSSGNEVTLTNQQEVVNMEEIERTSHKEQPPAPPRPPVPVEIPNDEIIPDEILNIDAELRIDEKIKMPDPPSIVENKGEEENFFIVVEQMPKLIDGLQDLQQKIRYPEKARRRGIEGRVIIQFIINEKGEVENPNILRGIGGGCDEEVLRVVTQVKFEPGRQRGKPVPVQFSLPVLFKLRY
ncbi:energy transducer TonB [Aliifodinibius sp. S!AR15-10]|uniref:energy transducer TonB n=1 Tax=Aliifodinibius sp. S!AR15-10 TaxID=2950437 RepID=UPI002861C074|nr:energy transducer TonB [Aliifodinibius sp. S!AR15-10]MDR8392509.1 energy transducer TonB [Aliifodinibius sp. S!AR15-10]